MRNVDDHINLFPPDRRGYTYRDENLGKGDFDPNTRDPTRFKMVVVNVEG